MLKRSERFRVRSEGSGHRTVLAIGDSRSWRVLSKSFPRGVPFRKGCQSAYSNLLTIDCDKEFHDRGTWSDLVKVDTGPVLQFSKIFPTTLEDRFDVALESILHMLHGLLERISANRHRQVVCATIPHTIFFPEATDDGQRGICFLLLIEYKTH